MEYPPKLRTKKRCWQQQQQTGEAPLPIPIQSLSNKPASNSRWFYYTARLIDGSVLVQKEGDQHFLHRMGCFGKGNLSRGKPEHVHFMSSFQGHQRKTLPATERRFQQSRFQKVRQHRYERHLSWSKLKVLKIGEKEQIDSEGNTNAPSTSKEYQPACIGSKVIEENEDMGDTSWKEDSSSEIEEKGEKSTCLHDKTCDVDVSEWTPQVDKSKEGHSSYNICDSQEQFLKKETSKLEENILLNLDTSWTDIKEEGDHKKGVKRDHTGYVRSQQCESCSGESHPINMSTDIGLRDDVMKVKCLTGMKKGMGTGDIRCSSDDDCRMKKDMQLEQQSPVSKSDTELTQFKVLDESNVGHHQTKLRNSKLNETQNQKRHRQEDKEKTQKMKSKQVIRKPDPYPVQEFLQLSYEESFFLSYGLGCLTLLKPSTTSAEESPMNLVDIWKEFLILKPRFPATYACYHYYRSKGWVPRCGIKYGCDFVVYKKGPSFYHSSFAVLAHLVEEGSEMTSALASWYNFTGFSRIIENAAKDIILCYVTYPEEFTELHLKSPACIPHLKVHEICMKRWRPTRERELKEDYPP